MALQCITDRMPCCRSSPNTAGEWFFPDGTMVPGQCTGQGTTFCRNRGEDDGTVHLNRISNVMSPTGLFCCEVPDATGVMQRICARVCESWLILSWCSSYRLDCHFLFFLVSNVQITGSSAAPIAGQSYTLTCSVSGTSANTYQWMRNSSVLLDKTTEVLSFSPLRLFDGGQYTCEATVGPRTLSDSVDVIVQGYLCNRYLLSVLIIHIFCICSTQSLLQPLWWSLATQSAPYRLLDVMSLWPALSSWVHQWWSTLENFLSSLYTTCYIVHDEMIDWSDALQERNARHME